MSNSRNLSQNYEIVKGILRTGFNSVEGEAAILAMLNDQFFPEMISAELQETCKFLITSLVHEDKDVSNLTRMAMNGALLSTTREGRQIVACFEQKRHGTTSLDNAGFLLCEFGTLTPIQFNAFCEMIKVSNIDSIPWTGDHLSSENFMALCEAIGKSRVVHLDMYPCNLKLYDNACIQALCNIISSKLTSFKVHWNDLPNDEKSFEVFCKAIEISKLGGLDFAFNRFNAIQIDSKKLGILSKTVRNNLTITDFCVPYEWCTLEYALRRNRLLEKIKNEIHDVLKYTETRVSLWMCSFQRSDRVIKEHKEFMALRLESFDDHLALVQNEIDELKKIQKKVMRKIVGLLQDEKRPMEAIKFLLDIPSAHSCYLEAHAMAFQIMYNGHYDTEAPSAQAALNAFINAASCCISEEGDLLKFGISDQAFVDSCLMAAAGIMQKGINELYNIKPEERMALLQYVLLLSLKSTLPKHHHAHHAILFRSPISCFSTKFSLLPSAIHSLSEIDNLKSLMDDIYELGKVSFSVASESLEFLSDVVYRLKPELLARPSKRIWDEDYADRTHCR